MDWTGLYNFLFLKEYEHLMDWTAALLSHFYRNPFRAQGRHSFGPQHTALKPNELVSRKSSFIHNLVPKSSPHFANGRNQFPFLFQHGGQKKCNVKITADLTLLSRLYVHFYVWGQIELNSLIKHTNIQIFGHFGCRFLIVSQMTSLLSKNMKKL